MFVPRCNGLRCGSVVETEGGKCGIFSLNLLLPQELNKKKIRKLVTICKAEISNPPSRIAFIIFPATPALKQKMERKNGQLHKGSFLKYYMLES